MGEIGFFLTFPALPTFLHLWRPLHFTYLHLA